MIASSASSRSAGKWPKGRFTFTIMDDTDRATLTQIRPFYDALRHYGLRTTKTIWPLPTERSDPYWGEDLTHEPHRRWLHELREAGFEISFHGARSGGSPREVTREGLDCFEHEFGSLPATYANHAANAECLYWGGSRFDVMPFRIIYHRLRSGPTTFYGDDDASPYYWADLCASSIRYVRNFTYANIVTTEADRYMPYHDPKRPFVRAWFSASEGGDVNEFLALLSDRNIAKLEESGGACIVYTHSAKGFVRDGCLDPRVERALARLAGAQGWFEPVCTVLEHMEAQRGLHDLAPIEHAELESRWLFDHAAKGWASLRKRIASR